MHPLKWPLLALPALVWLAPPAFAGQNVEWKDDGTVLLKLGDAYNKMGARFADKSAAAYTRIVKDYPLSPYADEAKAMLEQMEKPIPAAECLFRSRTAGAECLCRGAQGLDLLFVTLDQLGDPGVKSILRGVNIADRPGKLFLL